MAKKYRPKGWEELKHKLLVKLSSGFCASSYANGIEDGADGIVEALFQLASESPTKTFTIDSRITHAHARIYDLEKQGEAL